MRKKIEATSTSSSSATDEVIANGIKTEKSSNVILADGPRVGGGGGIITHNYFFKKTCELPSPALRINDLGHSAAVPDKLVSAGSWKKALTPPSLCREPQHSLLLEAVKQAFQLDRARCLARFCKVSKEFAHLDVRSKQRGWKQCAQPKIEYAGSRADCDNDHDDICGERESQPSAEGGGYRLVVAIPERAHVPPS